jgi:hypothetical protein
MTSLPIWKEILDVRSPTRTGLLLLRLNQP